jgi:DNA-binding transcriptional regulator YdaS (Cro superfamily)
MTSNPVQLVRQAAGTTRKLAATLGIRHQAISNWTQIPTRHIFRIEQVYGIPRSVLRPDLYPPDRERKRRAAG